MWYIGQEVVCVETHPNGLVKEGKIYTVSGIRGCKCGTALQVGVTSGLATQCTSCGVCTTREGEQNALSCLRFAPLDSLMKEEIAELMKCEEIFGVKINE